MGDRDLIACRDLSARSLVLGVCLAFGAQDQCACGLWREAGESLA